MTYLLLAALVALQLADIWTTLRVLAQGGRELNPLLAYLFARFGARPVLLVIKAALATWLWWFAHHYTLIGLWGVRITIPQFLGVCCVLYALIVLSNWRQIKK